MKTVSNIPAMTPKVVHDYLREIGKSWKGQGSAIELGSWLGATAVPLLEGLVEAGYDLPFYAYDIWTANEAQVEKAKNQGLTINVRENLLPIFEENVKSVYLNCKTYQGNIVDTIDSYPGDEIEICLFDAPKRNPVFIKSIRSLIDYWIPGVTILGLLDFYFYKKRNDKMKERFMAPITFMERNKGCFTKIADWPDQCSCAFFRYEKPIKFLL